MTFHSRFLDHVPFQFSHYDSSQVILSAAEKAENLLQRKLVPVSRLMYRGGEDKIFDKQTRKLFTGVVRIASDLPEDKFERILRIKDGREVFSLVRVKGGKNYQAEVIGGAAKKFDTGLSDEEIAQQTDKMLTTDKNFYQTMMKNFKNQKFITIKK